VLIDYYYRKHEFSPVKKHTKKNFEAINKLHWKRKQIKVKIGLAAKAGWFYIPCLDEEPGHFLPIYV
jgi:hypothetical protein